VKLLAIVLLGSALMTVGATAAEAGAGYRHGGGHRGHNHGHRHYHHRGYYGSSFYFYPSYYAYPRYYAPPVYYAPPPAVYVEQPALPAVAGDWYYCGSARGYYPEVPACPEGWQRVAPRP
jgi:hypothetical protein